MNVILDARKMDEKESAHQYLKRIFGFPEYYGNNLDALYDCLSEINDLNVHIIHAQDADNYFPRILSVFEDLEDANVQQIH